MNESRVICSARKKEAEFRKTGTEQGEGYRRTSFGGARDAPGGWHRARRAPVVPAGVLTVGQRLRAPSLVPDFFFFF